MTIILFIVVLAILILVHEIGHFVAARSVGVRVDEFGLGFPPRATSWKPEGGETRYSINWIPFGGFVKLFMEDGESDIAARTEDEKRRGLAYKSPLQKIWVLAAGVLFNFALAWALISIGFMTGLPSSVTPETRGLIGEPVVMIIGVAPGTPAEDAGLLPGDEIAYLELPQSTDRLTDATVEEVQTFIGARAGEPFTLGYRRDGTEYRAELVPTDTGEGGRGLVGVALDTVGVVQLPWHQALIEGVRTTGLLTVSIAQGLGSFIIDAFSGNADFSQIAGPVGIAGLVGDAASRGFVALISFTALISINLAVLNLIPFPALDGGRILFVIIEAIKGSPLKASVANVANTIGFLLLILLMVVVTISDVVKLFAN